MADARAARAARAAGRAACVLPLARLVVVAALAGACAPPAPASSSAAESGPPAASADAPEAVATALVRSLGVKDFAGASSHFDATMRDALPADKFARDWASIEDGAGAFRDVAGASVRTEQGLTVVLVRCRMARAGLVARVVFKDGLVAGLFFQNDPSAVSWSPPPYDDASAYAERDVVVGDAPPLPGTLSMPAHATSVPGIVLVHGSGPGDRDEVLGTTKVFRDLAAGLASKGVAVLRYDKRTRASPAGVVTVKEEVVDGALAALALLRATPGVDPARVFLLGHSLGGYLAPRIAQTDGHLAGAVIFAGNTRSLEDAGIAQLEYILSLNPPEPVAQKLQAALEQARALKATVESPDLQPNQIVHAGQDGSAPLPGAYFLDLRGYHPAQVAASLRCPLLVLQGGRDWQVTVGEDFAGWQAALRGVPTATFKTYPSLDHRFVAGTGPSSPAQYRDGGHVDAAVITDIADWVRAPARP
ncbi:MAG TPA: DUF3887 domain-containing protein [Polyangiaceae bacterium]|nr:DUF3887 domain-containing protein [Polyangiaceae bacterium]